MAKAEQLITEHLDIWTSAFKAKSSAGRGSSKKLELYGITKLRELILDLAVRGMLIPQDPADEKSSILLKQASAERSILERDRTIKTVRIKPSEADEEPFKIPGSWCWARFPQLCHYSPGKTPSTKNPSFWASGEDALAIPWVSISDMLHSGSISTTNKKVSALAKKEVFKREAVKAGSILMSFKLTVGKISRILVDAYHNEAIISVIPFTGILDEYIFKFLPTRALAGNTKSAIMGNTLNASSLAQLLIPLPPLAEQHRIVAKVDELMALCDQLEEEQENNIETHKTLVSTLLNALTSAAADASQFAEAWQRIHNNIDILFTTESSVDQLEQSILQLAVMGKLVPQDPEDESTKTLFVDLEKERRAFAEDNKFRSPAPGPVDDSSIPFIIPAAWKWCKLASIFNTVTDGDHLPPPKSDDGIAFLTIGNITTGKLEFDGCRFVQEAYYRELADFRRPIRGDILYTVVGATYGRPALVETDRPFCVQRHIAILKPSRSLDPRFLMIVLGSPLIYEQATAGTTGTAQPTIPLGSLRHFVVPLPPLAEQRRIGDKVDELTTLCDQLRASLSAAQITQLNLANSLVEQAIK